MQEDNFYSIDKLVAFGLGLTVAQQMANYMNSALRNTHIPGPETPIAPALAMPLYAMLDGKQAGPLTEQELSRLILEGKVSKSTYVWHPGMAKWEVAENVPAVLKLVALTPPQFNPEESPRG